MNKLRVSGILSIMWMLCAASVGMSAESQGMLEVHVKDHREAIGDFSKLTLTVHEILLSPRAGPMFWRAGWRSLAPVLGSLDLTRHTGARSAIVFRGPVGVASFDAIHLKIKSVDATLKKTGATAQVKNSVGPIKLAFATASAGATIVVVDLVVLDLSDHSPQTYELGVKGYELYQDGKLIDKVPPG